MRLFVPERSVAVLIGTSGYRSAALDDVPHVANNLTGLAAALTDPRLGGLPSDRCVVVHDPADGVTVDRALRRHAAAAEDTLVVYYAGHGLTTLKRHEFYLGLPGTDVEALRVSALPFDVIREILAESPAANRVLVLDCCYSGRVTADHLGADDDVVLAQLDIEGTYTLASAPGTSIALYDAADTYTAFTGMLINLLRTGVPGGPELLTLNEIYRRLRYAATTSDLPKPQRRGTGTTDLLALSRNPAYVPGQGRPEELTVDEPPSSPVGSPITDPQARVEALQRVGEMLAGPNPPVAAVDAALRLASRVTRRSTREAMLGRIVWALAIYDAAEARSVAAAITDTAERRKALLGVAQVLAGRDMGHAQEVLADVARLDADSAAPHHT